VSSRWRYRKLGREHGPISFRELLTQVRGGDVVAEDLVRPEHSDCWQRADSVAGLFYMACRHSSASGNVTGPGASDVQEGALDTSDGLAPMSREWITELISLAASHRKSESASVTQHTADDISPPSVEVDNFATIASLVDEFDRCEAMRRNRSTIRIRLRCAPEVFSNVLPKLAILIRPAVGFVAAASTATLLIHWSQREAGRFPGLLPKDIHLLPLWGQCPLYLYVLFIVDVMFVVAVLTSLMIQWTQKKLT
jgi:hypothetical protein